MSIRPLADNIIALRIDPETITGGGILIPDSAQTKELICSVMAIGPDVASVTIGEDILVGKYLGTEATIDGQEILVIAEEDVLGVVESD